MKTLLNKSLSQFIGCTIIALVLSIPLFYFITKYFYAEDLIEVIESIQNKTPLPELDLERDIIIGTMLQFLFVFFILSISTFITLRFISVRNWNPFDDTLKKIESFKLEEDKCPEFRKTNISEFFRLNNSIKNLIDRSQKSFLIQKEFTENASHELQTPIAILKSKTDLLMQENLNENQLVIIQDMYDTINRMARLNKNLLLLAKIENNQFESQESINLNQFINDLLSTYKDLYPETKIDLTSDGNCIISANHSLLEILINNLLINAIRHNSNNEVISIRCKKDTIEFKNFAQNGALDSNSIFNRFNYSSDKSRGTGIGLSISKAICKYHHWNINCQYKSNQHIFKVIFI